MKVKKFFKGMVEVIVRSVTLIFSVALDCYRANKPQEEFSKGETILCGIMSLIMTGTSLVFLPIWTIFQYVFFSIEIYTAECIGKSGDWAWAYEPYHVFMELKERLIQEDSFAAFLSSLNGSAKIFQFVIFAFYLTLIVFLVVITIKCLSVLKDNIIWDPTLEQRHYPATQKKAKKSKIIDIRPKHTPDYRTTAKNSNRTCKITNIDRRIRYNQKKSQTYKKRIMKNA